MQNHYAVHRRTAAELIVERADADKEHMGLTTWETAPHGKIIKTDVTANETAIQTPEISACRGKRGVRRVRGAIVPVVAEVYRRPRRVDGHAAQSKQEILRADLRAERQAVRQPKMRAAEPPHETSFAGTPGADFLRQAFEDVTPAYHMNIDNKLEEHCLQTIPLGRLIQPREIADAIVFLASERAAMVTGQVIKVSGGHAL